jgi:hypothetical protein
MGLDGVSMAMISHLRQKSNFLLKVNRSSQAVDPPNLFNVLVGILLCLG